MIKDETFYQGLHGLRQGFNGLILVLLVGFRLGIRKTLLAAVIITILLIFFLLVIKFETFLQFTVCRVRVFLD